MAYDVCKFDYEVHSGALRNLWGELISNSSQERMEKVYLETALGRAETSLIFHNSTEGPVGCVSCFPLEIPGPNSSCRLKINFDMMIGKKHRTLGPAIMVLRGLVDEVKGSCDGLLAMPNEKSQPVFKKLGYRHIGDSRRWSKIIRSHNKVTSKVKNPIVSKLAGGFLDSILYFFSFEFLCFLWATLPFTSRWTDRINSSFDAEEVEVLVARPELKSYVAWRYSKGIGGKGARYYKLYKNDKLNAVIAYSLNKAEVVVHDVISVDSGRMNMVFVLARFISKMRYLGIESISLPYFGQPDMVPVFKALGFFRREGRGVFLMVPDDTNKEKVESCIFNYRWFEGTLDL